jgi:hypothetical protein
MATEPNYVTAEDWERAVRWQLLNYPPDIFPPNSDSVDARSGTFARKVCNGIIERAKLYAETRHNDGEVP